MATNSRRVGGNDDRGRQRTRPPTVRATHPECDDQHQHRATAIAARAVSDSSQTSSTVPHEDA